MSGQPSRLPLAGLRVVYFGMGGSFSRLPLEALLRAGVDLRAVVEPADVDELGGEPITRLEPSPWMASGAARRGLAMAGGGTGRGLREIAAAAGAPVYRAARLGDTRAVATLAALQPDAICVACFTRRLPDALLKLPRLGALNAHPSLLPDNRGPDPLFWTFHSGARQTGVTIHQMSGAFDSGPILAQRAEPLIVGEGEAALEARLAEIAGALFVQALAGLRAGTLSPSPQDEARASSHPWSQAGDYAISADWEARRAWAFARGIIGRGQPIILTALDGARFRLIEPLGYTPEARLDEDWRMAGERLALALADGVFDCRAERLEGDPETANARAAQR
jgi:methionyl-tRNA formyltransferase